MPIRLVVSLPERDVHLLLRACFLHEAAASILTVGIQQIVTFHDPVTRLDWRIQHFIKCTRAQHLADDVDYFPLHHRPTHPRHSMPSPIPNTDITPEQVLTAFMSIWCATTNGAREAYVARDDKRTASMLNSLRLLQEIARSLKDEGIATLDEIIRANLTPDPRITAAHTAQLTPVLTAYEIACSWDDRAGGWRI